MTEFARIDELIAKAGENGVLQLNDIVKLIPDAAEDDELLESIVAALDSENVELDLSDGDDEEDDFLDIDTGSRKEALNNVPVGDFISRYMLEANPSRLLTFEEEIELAKRIEAGKHAKDQQEDMGDEISAEINDELERLIQRGEDARDMLFQANTRLVISIAKKYYGQGLDFLDLIQEGNIGLLTAVEKYDYSLGNRFSTYATWWIRQGITRALVNHGRTIRIPAHQAGHIRKLYRYSRTFEQEHGRRPTPEELAEELELTPDRVRFLQQITRPLLALEQPAGEDRDAELGDFIEDIESEQPSEIVSQKIFKEQIGRVLAQLSPREASVLRLRYGLQGTQPHTLKEVGRLFDLSRERIRQIEKTALRKLRHISFSGELPYYLN